MDHEGQNEQLPSTTRCLVLTKVQGAPPALNETSIKERPIPSPLPEGYVLVRIVAAAFNHRELWQKKGLYPGITDGAVMGCDGAGIVIASPMGTSDPLLHKRVFLTPTRGWKSDPTGPEQVLGSVGGGANPPIGTITEYVVVERDELVEIPDHLSFEEASAWPCAGVTAWRVTFVKGAVKPGHNVLITGCGGGVALTCLQLAVAAGANVYVTSGSQDKIDKAVKEFGAKGGVSYKNAEWQKELGAILKAQSPDRPLLDVVIDQGGGDITDKVARIIKNGGIISSFGMHTGRSVQFPMVLVMKNVEFRGSTLGSQAELEEATRFIAEKKIKPVVSEIIEGLDNAERGFELMEKGNQMGKIVVRIAKAGTTSPKL